MSGCYCHGHWVFFYGVEEVWGLMVSNTLISKASPDRSRESITRQGGFSETCGWLTGALAKGACPAWQLKGVEGGPGEGCGANGTSHDTERQTLSPERAASESKSGAVACASTVQVQNNTRPKVTPHADPDDKGWTALIRRLRRH